MPISQPGKFRTSTVDNSFGGDGAGTGNLGDNNTFVGAGVALDNVGDNNTYVGSNIAAQNSQGSRNTVIGSESFANFQLGGAFAPDDMTIVGAFNMAGIGSPTPSMDIISVGTDIGQPATSSQVFNRCIFIGKNLAKEPGTPSAEDVVNIGTDSVAGTQDVIIGTKTGTGNSIAGARNVIIGHTAGANQDNAFDSVLVGHLAGRGGIGTTNIRNVCVGQGAGRDMSGVSENVFVGYLTGNSASVGNNNTMIGARNGGGGSGNIYIGRDIIGGLAGTADDTLAIQGDNSPFLTPLISGDFVDGNFGLNLPFGGADYGNGRGVFSLADVLIAPNANSNVGGLLYSEAGALKWRGSGGTITTLGAA